MDRFSWSDGILAAEEQLITQQNGVRIYDGTQKTAFDHGKLVLTSHRVVWKDHKDQKCILTLPLSYVVLIEEEGSTLTKSAKSLLHLSSADPQRPSGPSMSSSFSFIRFSFTEGGQKEFHRAISEAVQRKRWDVRPAQTQTVGSNQKQLRTGISGIEKNIQQRHMDTDRNISQAFEDLSKLMDKAKEMVAISRNISTKLKEKQGDITEDETLQFKSYLLSLGIDDPVTRDAFGSSNKYFQELAKQISDIMEQPLKNSGGVMTLSDVYCRLNRARGLELLSPDDLVNACRTMDLLQLPVRLHVFESGVMVLQLRSHSNEATVADTERTVEKNGSLTAEELAKIIGSSVVLSKERLLTAEKLGKLCRDESSEGLRFFQNLLLTKAS